MVDRDTLQYYRRRLESEKAREMGLLERLEDGLQGEGQRDSLAELSVCDNHPADIGTETFERSKDIGLCHRGQVRLARIDDALARVAGGTYGVCRDCGAVIPGRRLEAMPEAALCIKCQELSEAREGVRIRPVEESAIAMPFGGVPGGENATDNMYDGQDSWDDVAGYGTSSDTVSHDERERGRDTGDSVGGH